MVKFKDSIKPLDLVDISAFVLALGFVYSVVSNVRDLVEQGIKDSPASLAVLVSLALVAYSGYNRKKINGWGLVTLSVIVTAAIIWLFGLSATSR